MKTLIVFIGILGLQACAFTDVNLEIIEDQNAAFKGPLSTIESREFQLEGLGDLRMDKERIGWVKNGYGMNTADILSPKPVNEIVLHAVQTALTKNGHVVNEVGSITVAGEVNQFWFESDVNFWTVEFTGSIESTLRFIDKNNQSTIYQSTYNGSYSEKVGAGYTKTWQRIMSKALDNLIEEIIYDSELVDALENKMPEEKQDSGGAVSGS